MITRETLTRDHVEAYRAWLRKNSTSVADYANAINDCRAFYDRRFGAHRRIEVKERLCTRINASGILDNADGLRHTEKTPSATDWARAEQRAKRRQPSCSKCGDPTHRLPDCPERNRY